MKTCILITSHLNTPQKVKIAEDLIIDLKSKTDLPIIFVGNYPIPLSIQHKVNYSLYTDNNTPAKVLRWVIYKNKRIPSYALQHCTQTLTGMKFIKSLGFEYTHHFNYDIFLKDEEFNKLLEKGKSGNFLYYNFGGDGIHTDFFSIKPEEFISKIEPNLHYLDNANPPGIKPTWIGETFFEWVFLKYYPNFKDNYCDIKFITKFNHLSY